MQKLLITDSDPAFCKALSAALNQDFQVFCCSDGYAACEMALRLRPELMVLDLTLPGMDGITLLQRLRAASLPTLVLATTVLTSRYVMRSLQTLDVQYLLRKPCTIEAMQRHIRILSQSIEAILHNAPALHDQVSDILLKLGISSKLCGHTYIISGVLLMLYCPDTRVTKELYPRIGQLHNSTGKLVERSIRNAIGVAWKHRNPAVWQAYFPSEVTGGIRPTNRTFLSRLTECLRRTLRTRGISESPATTPGEYCDNMQDCCNQC